jgi:hypothetical protein
MGYILALSIDASTGKCSFFSCYEIVIINRSYSRAMAIRLNANLSQADRFWLPMIFVLI